MPNFSTLKSLVFLLFLTLCAAASAQDTLIIASPAPLSVHRMDSLIQLGAYLEEVLVTAIRGGGSPVANTQVSKKDIAKNNLGVDLPYLVEQTPSVVVSSDAGAGIGYTGMRIRGSDGSRINVTVNGIPINDPESQQVFWVNMPDFASSSTGIQIQRGVGTSSNGAGAFGGTLSMDTYPSYDAYFSTSNSFGSFGTRKHSIQFATGKLRNRFSLEGRLSYIRSDGYVDRSGAELMSYFLNGEYQVGNATFRATIFTGKEKTQQAWYGTPGVRLRNDAQGIEDYIAYNGLSPAQADNLRNSDRRYNHYLYDNQIDNYKQDHYQLHWLQQLGEAFFLKTALHYTKGRGYFEEYQDDEAYGDNTELAFYGLLPVAIGQDTIWNSDLVRRRWLDNDLFGGIYSLRFSTPNRKLGITLGGGWNHFFNEHFGEVTWARFASNADTEHRYYTNDAGKTDGNTYLQIANSMDLGNKVSLLLFADLQHRMVKYRYQGGDEPGAFFENTVTHHFFNPKVGATFNFGTQHIATAYLGMANREPNRNDYTDAAPGRLPRAETLLDFELGYKWRKAPYSLEATGYWMSYKNELVLTGQLNDVGAYTRVNVPRSQRLGLELVASYQGTSGLTATVNATLSQNKIKAYTEYVDDWDNGGQIAIERRNVDLAFSPAVIAGGEVSFDFFENGFLIVPNQHLRLAFVGKYVSKQYLDNTQDDARSLSGYFTGDVRLNYQLQNLGKFPEISLHFLVRNIFDNLYSANGWAYRFSSGGQFRQLDGFYPQAGRHWFAGIDIKF